MMVDNPTLFNLSKLRPLNEYREALVCFVLLSQLHAKCVNWNSIEMVQGDKKVE